MIRTRFAPSPTGYLHIGGARTALFSWAFARKHGGTFVLRIEDTDLERSTPESVKAILDSMEWLKLGYDEGPFYQMQRMDRYNQVIQHLLDEGKAYHCYASIEELDKMREAQRAAGLKPRYDGRWRDSTATPPVDVKPVIRFKNPIDGEVIIDDLVKGTVIVQNTELDDLIIARADGTPTYNFCVVVDDWDMEINHVIRGDDHLNNTPRQINILKALGAPIPKYAHVPMILGHDGERLSKRHGAVSVMQYFEDGYLPEALLNYLARLGWSHGDEEIFSLSQLVEWFDLKDISKSPAKFNPEKLTWVNQQYIKATDNPRLVELTKPFMEVDCCNPAHGPDPEKVIGLLKDRVNTLKELADAAVYFYRVLEPHEDLKLQHLTAEVKPALSDFATKLESIEWKQEAINALLKETVGAHGLKFPKIAMPLRIMITGETQTPSIDAIIELLGREESLRRVQNHLQNYPV
ncbi:glutamate--tRNA ligase [Sulfurirhabdus autotrophica]|uniref:Glutamate--tRNA ligase n=1 Tax=Sulfurirhabdus autotrophica TaxID=1706046 RepID=A0A4R3YEA6_9PROT|nr:glutamate--tRNA ligase [Sulfurirhabdus autotrophica]TCV90865.1 glutamyl-tRNA synthetase [Sulfurirhabdus autotrophica]